MASWVIVQLDTTAPGFTVGAIPQAEAGQTVTLDFTLTEGEVSGILYLPDGVTVTGSVVGSQMSFDVPADTENGAYDLIFTATDEYDNSIDIHNVVYVGFSPGVAAGGEPFTYGGGPWMKPWEQVVPGRAQLDRETVFHVVGHVTLSALPRIDVGIPGSVHLSIPVEVTFAAIRPQASRWSRLIQEEEEILLSL